MPQSNKPRVSLVVRQEQKERWDDAVESGEYASMAELVRTSVKRELDGHHNLGAGGQTESSQAMVDATEEIVESLSRIENELGRVQERLRRVESQADTEGPRYDLEKVIFELLPTPPEDDENLMPAQFAVDTADLATRIGADESDVINALERLDDKSGQVQFGHTTDGHSAYKVE